MLRQLDEAARNGGSAFDFWFDTSPFGYALFRSYHYLPHLIIYGAFRLTNGAIGLETLLPCFTITLAAGLPWVFFHSARVLGFSWCAAISCGLFAPLLVEQGGYGLGLRNYLWGTHGIITQLWATFFLVPAIAYGVRFVQSGRSAGVLALLCFMAVGSHILSAYIIVGTFIIAGGYLVLTRSVDKATATRRLVFGVTGFTVLTAHQWIFILADRAFIHRSTLEPEWKFSSWGVNWVVSQFSSGALFDLDRIPIITGFILIGIAFVFANGLVAVSHKRRASDADTSVGIVTVCLVVWGSLLCGYQIWGWLFESLSFLSAMHLHRFILPVQICGVLIAGYGAGLLLSVFPSALVRGLLLVAFIALPINGALSVFRDAHDLIDRIEQTKAGEPSYQQIVDKLKTLPRGWIHAGMSKSWAKETAIAGVAPLYHLTVATGIRP